MRESYIRYIADKLVARVMRKLPSVPIVKAKPASLLAGTSMLPTLAPGLCQVGEALYLHEAPGHAAKRLYYAKLDDFFDWLQRSSCQELAMGVPRGGKHMGYYQRFHEALAKMDAPHEVQTGRGGERHVLGLLAGQRVLLSGSRDGGCGIVTSGDLDRVGAFLGDLPVSRVWGVRTHENVPVEAFAAAGRRPEDKAFERAVRRLGEIVRSFGTAKEVAIPADLPARPTWVLESVNGTAGAVPVMSLAKSEEILSKELRRWFGKRPARSSWMGRAASVKEARALLPRRARVVFLGTSKRKRAMLVTDEDAGTDDPVVLSLGPWEERIVIASSRLSATLAGASIRRVRDGAETAKSLMGLGGQPRDAISPLVDSFYELAPGVFSDQSTAWFTDVGAYAAYLESLRATRLALFAPPKRVIAFKPKTSALVVPDALRKRGFKTFDIRSFFGATGRRGAFGRVDGAPVWVSHFKGRAPRAPTIFCLRDDAPKVTRWLAQCAKGSTRLQDGWREWW
jgi:hypothetical protein